VHYPGDVLIGSLMGTGAAVAVRYTGRVVARRQRLGRVSGSSSSSRQGTPLSAT
jgi:hypothetical protein